MSPKIDRSFMISRLDNGQEDPEGRCKGYSGTEPWMRKK